MTKSENRLDLTILVNSCDLYEDAWYPFFKLLQIQWPQCDTYPIILNTETKKYDCEFLNIHSFSSNPELTWSRRLLNCLSTIDSEYILFFLEDEFLLKPVNENELFKVIHYMDCNPDVGVVYPHKNKKQTIDIDEDYFSRDLITNNRRLVCICAIWRKSYLKKIIKESESPWDFEENAPERSKQYPDRVLQYNKRLPDLIVYDDQIEIGYGITAKKWLPKTKELFDRYGIQVNYNNLGFYPYENQVIAAKEEAKKRRKLFSLNPVEFAYNIKKRITKLK